MFNMLRHQLCGMLFIARGERGKNLAMFSHGQWPARALLDIQTPKTLDLFANRIDHARETPIACDFGKDAMKTHALDCDKVLIVRLKRSRHAREDFMQTRSMLNVKVVRGKGHHQHFQMLTHLIQFFDFGGFKAVNDDTLPGDGDEPFLFEAAKGFAHRTAGQADLLRDFALDEALSGLELSGEDGATQSQIRFVAQRTANREINVQSEPGIKCHGGYSISCGLCGIPYTSIPQNERRVNPFWSKFGT